MGILDIFKKTEPSTNPVVDNSDVQSKINLIKEREQKVTISLAKKTDTPIQARVNIMVDISGSMSHMFSSGRVQEVLERLFPIALTLDDNKELDVWVFNNSSSHINPSVRMDNFSNYISTYFPSVGGGTSYSPVMNDVVRVSGEDNSIPCFNIMLTDGDNGDKIDTEAFIKSVSNKHHFWQFVGLGSESFYFLEKLDTLPGRIIDNANFFSVNDISKLSDEHLYDKLLSEFPSWLKEAKSKGIVM